MAYCVQTVIFISIPSNVQFLRVSTINAFVYKKEDFNIPSLSYIQLNNTPSPLKKRKQQIFSGHWVEGKQLRFRKEHKEWSVSRG